MPFVQIIYSDSGTSPETWHGIVPEWTNTGYYEWTVPSTISSNCYVAVYDKWDDDPSDTSDAAFSIVPGRPTITVTSPNGGESLAAGSTHGITWTRTGLTGSAVTIHLYKNGVLSGTLGTADAS